MSTLYVDKSMGVNQIADELDCSPATILKWLKKHGIPTRKQPQQKTPYFGIDDEGYEYFKLSVDNKTKNVAVHRLVAVAEYGVDAVIGKYIHHRNEIPWDNRPSNLEPMTSSEHCKHHEPYKNSPVINMES